MPETMLVLHIGLPKTATTFLQHWILKPAMGKRFIHRKRGQRPRLICHYLKDLTAASDSSSVRDNTNKLRVMLNAYRQALPDTGSIVVSDENISGRAIHFWQDEGPGPTQIAERLAYLAEQLKGSFPTVKVIVGVRRQDQWLASRYAESSTVFDAFSQADFDRRLGNLANRDTLGPVFGWLDYRYVYDTFADALGTSNFLILPMEALRNDPVHILTNLSDFIAASALPTVYEKLVRNDMNLIRNTLSAGDNTWRLRRDATLLRLDPRLQDALMRRLADSNTALNQVVPLHFA